MNVKSVLLVALALLPFLILDGVSAAPSSGTSTAVMTVRPAVIWASPGTLQRNCSQIVSVEPRSASRQTPDTIADCRESYRAGGWIMTHLPVVPVWASRNEIVF